MTHPNRRFALAYLVLVIVPIVGLAGLLRSGHKLIAPAAIGGAWDVRLEQDILTGSPCGVLLVIVRDAGFTISQSGTSFTLSVAGGSISALSGSISGTAIKASLVVSAERGKEVGCDSARTLSLTATLDSQTNPGVMAGVLSVNDCPACTEAEFHAVRKEKTHTEGSN